MFWAGTLCGQRCRHSRAAEAFWTCGAGRWLQTWKAGGWSRTRAGDNTTPSLSEGLNSRVGQGGGEGGQVWSLDSFWVGCAWLRWAEGEAVWAKKVNLISSSLGQLAKPSPAPPQRPHCKRVASCPGPWLLGRVGGAVACRQQVWPLQLSVSTVQDFTEQAHNCTPHSTRVALGSDSPKACPEPGTMLSALGTQLPT